MHDIGTLLPPCHMAAYVLSQSTIKIQYLLCHIFGGGLYAFPPKGALGYEVALFVYYVIHNIQMQTYADHLPELYANYDAYCLLQIITRIL